MKRRGVYRKIMDWNSDRAMRKMPAKYKRRVKKLMNRRVRRLSEKPALEDWEEDLDNLWVADFNDYDLYEWMYCFDWYCGSPLDELECVGEPYYYSYDGVPVAITDFWYNKWIYEEYMEED